MFIARGMCGLTYVTVATLCSSYSLQKYLERWPAALNKAGRSHVNEETQNHGRRTPYISLVTTLFTVYAQQTQNTWRGDYCECVCAACPTPRLNLKFELRPSWNNIHDTFPTGIARIQHTGMQRRLNSPRVHAKFFKKASQLYFVRKRKTKNKGRNFYYIIDILINMRLEESMNSYRPFRNDPQNAAMQNTFVCSSIA